MKKLLIMFFSLALASTSFAQTGPWYIGGNVGLMGHTEEYGSYTQKSLNWTANPELGLFLRKDIQVGLSLGFNGTTYKDGDTSGYAVKNVLAFAPMIYARKHWFITDNFSVFLGANAGYTYGSQTMNNDTKKQGSGFSAYLNAGLWYQLNPKFAVAAQYGFLGYSEDNNYGYGKRSSFGFNVNTQGSAFNLGLYYTMNKKG